MEQQTGSKLGKEYIKAIYCKPAHLTYILCMSLLNAGLDEAQAGIKIVWRNINNLRYADDTTLMAKSVFRMDWLDLLAVQGILKSLLQHHSSKGT